MNVSLELFVSSAADWSRSPARGTAKRGGAPVLTDFGAQIARLLHAPSANELPQPFTQSNLRVRVGRVQRRFRAHGPVRVQRRRQRITIRITLSRRVDGIRGCVPIALIS